MILFRVEIQFTSFKYLNSEFCLVLDNDKCIGDIENDLKYRPGIGFDVSFYGFGNRKLQKGEFLYENSTITLKRTDERAEIVDCRIVDINLNGFIGDLNIRTIIKCFDG